MVFVSKRPPADVEDPEEAEALAAMRAAFAEDDDVPIADGGGASDEDDDREPDDPEETAAWNEVRVAFGDPDEDEGEMLRPLSGGKGKGKGNSGKAGTGSRKVAVDDQNEAKGTKKDKTSPAPKWRSKAAAPALVAQSEEALFFPRSKMNGDVPGANGEDWVQSQVDRLVGEVQRLVGAPFTPRLMSEFWSLPLEDQHDVLLGATGIEGGIMESKEERAAKLWQLIEGEVRARGGWHTTEPTKKAPAAGGRGMARREPTDGARSRSRSRSPSI